jgi:hypothetical protein
MQDCIFGAGGRAGILFAMVLGLHIIEARTAVVDPVVTRFLVLDLL